MKIGKSTRIVSQFREIKVDLWNKIHRESAIWITDAADDGLWLPIDRSTLETIWSTSINSVYEVR